MAVAVLAAPPAAAAQGAVDEQYRDPFAGQGDGGSDTAEPAPTDDAAPSTPPAAESPGAAAPEAAPSPAATGELPRTGLPAAPIAAAAVALTAAGAALRRRLH